MSNPISPYPRKPAQPESLRAHALDWIKRALIDELPDDQLENGPERAEAMHALCEAYAIRVECLIDWIHSPAPGKEWTVNEWRRWCQREKEERKRKAPENLPAGWPE